MAAVVVDASVLVDFLWDEDRASGLQRLATSVDQDLWIPAICDIEVAAALRRTVLTRRLSAARAGALLEGYMDLPLLRHGHEALLPRVLELVQNFTTPDATYVALAERLDAVLMTSDLHLARAVSAHTNLDVIV